MSKIKIKVNPKIVKAKSGFHDFYSKTDIYPKNSDEVFEVENTTFIQQRLATGELIIVGEVKEESKPEKEPEREPKKTK